MFFKFSYIGGLFSIFTITSVQLIAADPIFFVDLSLDAETSTSLSSDPALYQKVFFYLNLISQVCDSGLVDTDVRAEVKVAVTDLAHHPILNKFIVKSVAKALFFEDLAALTPYEIILTIAKQFEILIADAPESDLNSQLKSEFNKSISIILSFLIDKRCKVEQLIIDGFEKLSLLIKTKINPLKIQLVTILKSIDKDCTGNPVFNMTELGQSITAASNKLIWLLETGVLDFDLGTCIKAAQVQVDTKWTVDEVFKSLIKLSGILVFDPVVNNYATDLDTAKVTLTALNTTLNSEIFFII